MRDAKDDLRAVRAQEAVVRTIVDELHREVGAPAARRKLRSADNLRAQAIEESARLVSTMEGMAKRRESEPPGPAVRAGADAHVRAAAADAQTVEGVDAEASAGADERREQDARREQDERPHPRLLLVEDDDDVREVMAEWLGTDYDVTTARDGAEGLESARAHAPDVIVSDVSMPRMDGLSMVDRIRQIPEAESIPVIFVTGQHRPERIAHGFSAGAVSLLTKPVDLDLLDEELRSVLANGALRERGAVSQVTRTGR